jgi:hypothetical protein
MLRDAAYSLAAAAAATTIGYQIIKAVIAIRVEIDRRRDRQGLEKGVGD